MGIRGWKEGTRRGDFQNGEMRSMSGARLSRKSQAPHGSAPLTTSYVKLTYGPPRFVLGFIVRAARPAFHLCDPPAGSSNQRYCLPSQ